MDAARAPRHWSAITALVLGILAVLAGLVPFVGVISLVILGPLAVVFGVVSLLKTKEPTVGGRRMGIVGLCLGLAGIVAAIGMTAYMFWSLDRSYKSLYGSDVDTSGPGRSQSEALAFSETSVDAEGISITATEPVVVTVPTDVLQSETGWDIGLGITVTYTNTGDDPVLYQPSARGYVGDSECRDFVERQWEDPTQLAPGATDTRTFEFNCYEFDEPATQFAVKVTPEPYSTAAWFAGPIPAGANQSISD